MRVGVIGGANPDEFGAHIADALRQLGHAVTPVANAFPRGMMSRPLLLARAALPTLDERAQDRIFRILADTDCEVVINIDLRIAPGIVAKLRARGMRVAFWFPDALVNIGRQYMLLAPYNAVFLKDRHMVARMGAFSLTPIYYLPEACNPLIHRAVGPAATDPYLVIAGSMYPSRVRLLERLAAKGIPMAIYGGAFPRWIGPTPLMALHRGRPVFGAEKAAVFRSAAAVLNTLHPAEVEGMNARLFEATGSGAAVLSEFRPALPELFVPDEEVLAFRDFDELVSQAERLLADHALAARLGDAATARAHRDHTYERRVAAILGKLT